MRTSGEAFFDSFPFFWWNIFFFFLDLPILKCQWRDRAALLISIFFRTPLFR